MAGRILLDGHLDVPPDRLAAVAAVLPAHIALTRAEPGCIAFSVVSDPANHGRFLVSEIFASQAAFDAHRARGKGSAWADVTAGLPRHYIIRTED